MSYSRLLFAGLFVSNILIFPGYAAAATLNLKPGLWEMTWTQQTTGGPPAPEDVLARMTPERRAKFDAAIAANNATRASEPRVRKQCITEKSLQRGLNVGENKGGGSCQETLVSSTASVMNMRQECTGQEIMSGTSHFEAIGPEALTGAIDMTMTDGVRTTTVKRVMLGKWLGADCGLLKNAGD
jgi:hypothetical protein